MNAPPVVLFTQSDYSRRAIGGCLLSPSLGRRDRPRLPPREKVRCTKASVPPDAISVCQSRICHLSTQARRRCSALTIVREPSNAADGAGGLRIDRRRTWVTANVHDAVAERDFERRSEIVPSSEHDRCAVPTASVIALAGRPSAVKTIVQPLRISVQFSATWLGSTSAPVPRLTKPGAYGLCMGVVEPGFKRRTAPC